MADISVNAPRHRGARTDRLEYRLYFALIFAFALVNASIALLAALARRRPVPRPGPFARARAEARTIAPQIFRG